MIRLVLFLSAFCLLLPKTYGQITVFQDEKGQVLTTDDTYGKDGVNTTAYNKRTYLGSPFLTFPVWQEGKIRLDKHGKELFCELAYNLVTHEVLCRFPGDSMVSTITPDLFTIYGDYFLRQSSNLYAKVLYNGQTKLLVSLTKRLDPYTPANSKETSITGVYKTLSRYYIRKEEAKSEVINLTKSSLLKVLFEQSEKLAAKLPAEKLTPDDVAKTLTYYDSLMALNQANKLPLTAEPVFTQILHNKISYPDYARSQGVYGRVYAGFEIDEQGQIKNIAILSPENGGFRFDVVVRNALEKLPNVDPTLRGKYALPVAFTYTNANQKSGPYSPVNYLSADRLEGRTLLEEFVVPAVSSKSQIATREVWGYYK